MKSLNLFVYFIQFCLVAFQAPRYIYFTTAKAGQYHIMPQLGGPVSNSPVHWIIVHSIVSTILVAMICDVLRTRDNDQEKMERDVSNFDKEIFPVIMHYIFVLVVCFNSKHLGDLDETYAMAVNWVVTVTFCCLKFYWRVPAVMVVYLSILSIPLYLDFLVFLYGCYAMTCNYIASGIPPQLSFWFNLWWVVVSAHIVYLTNSFWDEFNRTSTNQDKTD